MIRSLRMRLFLGVTAVSVLTLAILSLAIDQAVRRTLQADFDRTLLEKARSLATMVEQSGTKTHFDFQAPEFPEFDAGPRPAYFEILLNGMPYQHSASLGAQHLLSGGIGKLVYETQAVELPNGRAGRMLTMAFQPLIEPDEPATTPAPDPLPHCVIAVAQDSADLHHIVEQLRWLLFALCGGAILCSNAVLLWVASRAVRPVKALARQIENVQENDLAARVTGGDIPLELEPVVDRLNDLLGRLEAAFSRERAFTADVAHELRTPLAGVLATLEVARTRTRDAAAYEASADKSLALLRQMQTLVENLLLLARADSGQLALRKTPTDIGAIVEECAAVYQQEAARRNVQFALTLEELPAVDADPELLLIAIRNLFDNAVSYACPGTAIAMRVLPGGGAESRTGMLEISNAGHALQPSDLPSLLQRFVRKDPARSATGVHAGLGLSICHRLLALHGMELSLHLEGDRFIARVKFAPA